MGPGRSAAAVRIPAGSPKVRRIKKQHDSVAQLVEQYTFNVWVLGSNPSGITKNKNTELLPNALLMYGSWTVGRCRSNPSGITIF